MTTDDGQRYEMRALSKGLSVLDCLLETGKPMKLDEVSLRTGLPKSTSFRVVRNLLDQGLIVSTPQGFWLGTKFLRFAAAVNDRLDVRDVARRPMAELLEVFGETVHLGVLEPDLRLVVYLEKLASARAVGIMMSRVGGTSPSHCTGLGKAMLAGMGREAWSKVLDQGLKGYTEYTITDSEEFFDELERIRKRGYSIDNREHEIEVRCVAASIRSGSGGVVAAISVAGPTTRMPEQLEGSELARAVTRAAQEISAQLA